MADRSSRPPASPLKTLKKVAKRIVSLGLRKRLGPLRRCTQVWRACRLNRLSRATNTTTR
ncbi:hypothetical protein CETAM_13155 [Corynebacterium comes]|uniref:Uncharacterized protein n=1 Tax=Corynebacterium comes TaxID=2675218 RepID=A0A6B8W4K3_9CORY|nr:hypothetical protein CETAM_13155 [Corynebacterium comes]